ncbi:MAG: plasmid pRiA4b ORF-3 family protein [Elusimicrobiales bacterium]|nr:plasmid pRiA4b ORF-3 family protein [Elusimicrobiales bacterium]
MWTLMDMSDSTKSIYQLKITLMGLEPPVWRRVLVPGDISLYNLHYTIQFLMGWQDSHLHIFCVGKEHFGAKSQDSDKIQDESKIILQDIAPKAGAESIYEYDMGDSWTHKIRVEKITPATAEFQGIECLTGERACPAEDRGGVWGYENMLAAIRDPKHEQHDEMVE